MLMGDNSSQVLASTSTSLRITVAVVLAGAAHGREPVDDSRLGPNEALGDPFELAPPLILSTATALCQRGNNRYRQACYRTLRGNRDCLVAGSNVKAAAPQKIAGKLIASRLVKEIRAKAGAPVWRHDEEASQSYALKLTVAGAKAIAIDESAESSHVGDEGNSREDVEQAG